MAAQAHRLFIHSGIITKNSGLGQHAGIVDIAVLEECVGRVETLSAGRVEAYTNRLYEKLKVILEDLSLIHI